ncbi:MAG TPA: VTT domain-containing protein [Methylomirabilota bacterium]|nr:VTT domain-containing protein [Methylomirabilota bacterium]
MTKPRASAPSGGPTVREKAAPTVRGRLLSFLPMIVIVLVGVGIVASGLHRHLSLDAFLAQRAALAGAVEANWPVALLAMGALYAAAVALSLPVGLALSLASGFLFGPLVGGVLVAVSATLGATALFLLARSSVGEVLRVRAGPKLQTFSHGFREDAFNYLLFLRLVPVAPFWLVNLAPALLGVSTPVYVAATALGILPATFTFTTLGAGLDSVIAAQEAANVGCVGDACRIHLEIHTLVTTELLVGFSALGVLSLAPVAVKRWRMWRRSRP